MCHSSLQGTPVALIVGVSIGGVVLLALIVLAYLLLRRRRKCRAPLRVDLMAETEPHKTAPAPSPWVSLGHAHPAPPSTWQLSSIVSGWRRIHGDGQTTTDSQSPTDHSEMWANSSTTASRQDVPPLPSSTFVSTLQGGGRQLAIANPSSNP
jgi:hypothetical protein